MNNTEREALEELWEWAESVNAPARVFVYINQADAGIKELEERRANERSLYVDTWQKGFNAGADWQKGAKSAEKDM